MEFPWQLHPVIDVTCKQYEKATIHTDIDTPALYRGLAQDDTATARQVLRQVSEMRGRLYRIY